MKEFYTKPEVVRELQISLYTLDRWYNWEHKRMIAENDSSRLPIPQKLSDVRGCPRVWTKEQIEQLKEFRKTYLPAGGGKGQYGKYSNSKYEKKRGNKNEPTK